MPELTLPYPPGVNHMYYHRNNRRFLTVEAKQFKKDVGNLAMLAGVTPMTGEIVLRIQVYRPRKVGDLDGRLKASLDALNKIAWEDDKQIVEIHATRHDDKHNPRIEVRWDAI
jgi:crossover junction endodeoxyribonuclease RusA